ncbi:ParB/RepB/Spo0J family partition protein [Oscillospiraceae bacterium LTW-04]|nr:ParB/RepB/Spo0J family partition protein [Oscillospiraceae bacterium MB24-C1]
MAKPKRGLGKGLEALFADNDTADVSVSTLAIGEIEPNQDQPRKEFSPEALSQLAESIKEHGILQPLVVRPRPNGRYQIVAGERRWRASRIAGLSELPVIIRELTDEQAFEVALVENLVRADLNPIEEALGYRTLVETFSMTQERIAQRVGRSRSAVANALRLLSLPKEVLAMLEKGNLSSGHARALLPLNEKDALEAANRVVSQALSVRQTEQLVKQMLKAPPAPKAPPLTPSFYREMELALKDTLSRRVKVISKGKGKGELVLEFYSDEELRELGEKLGK